MASNRDPRKTSRTRRQLRTSSSGRSARSKASAKDTPRPTSSTDRAKQQGKGSSRVTSSESRVKKNPVSKVPRGGQGPRTPPQQGPSRRVSGLIGSRGAKPVKKQSPPTPGRRFGGKVGTVAKVGTIVNPRSDIPAKVLAAASLAIDAAKALRGKGGPKKGTGKPMSSMGKNYKAKEKEAGRKAVASNFDRAFAAARKSGKTTFTWRGKKYNTKVK